MGETIAETRVEIAARRAEMESDADQLRDALNLGQRIRENPAMVIGIGAAAAFRVAGGPRRLARLLRRRFSPNAAEQAYDALPSTMQSWVSTLADEAGPKAAEVRDQLVEELKRWRRDPIKDKKARKELAKQMVEGPPGPKRAAWTAAETALGLIAAAVAKKAIDRFLTDEPTKGDRAAAATAASRATSAARAHNTAAGPAPDDYAGWSKPT
jgi:chaperonin GroEL (HSP60 family)